MILPCRATAMATFASRSMHGGWRGRRRLQEHGAGAVGNVAAGRVFQEGEGRRMIARKGGVGVAQVRGRVSHLGQTLFEVSTRAGSSAVLQAHRGPSLSLQGCREEGLQRKFECTGRRPSVGGRAGAGGVEVVLGRGRKAARGEREVYATAHVRRTLIGVSACARLPVPPGLTERTTVCEGVATRRSDNRQMHAAVHCERRSGSRRCTRRCSG